MYNYSIFEYLSNEMETCEENVYGLVVTYMDFAINDNGLAVNERDFINVLLQIVKSRKAQNKSYIHPEIYAEQTLKTLRKLNTHKNAL